MISISYTPFLDKEMPHLSISGMGEGFSCRCHHLMIGEIGIILNDAQLKTLTEKLVAYNANLESVYESGRPESESENRPIQTKFQF